MSDSTPSPQGQPVTAKAIEMLEGALEWLRSTDRCATAIERDCADKTLDLNTTRRPMSCVAAGVAQDARQAADNIRQALVALRGAGQTSEGQARPMPGDWPVGVNRAFVEGAAWWEWAREGATMWPADRDKAEAEAVRRYGPATPPAPSDTTEGR